MTCRVSICRLLLFGLLMPIFGCPSTTPTPVTEQKKEKPISQSGPRLSFDRTTYDAGEVDLAVPCKGWFTVKNSGDAPLSLSLASRSCFCTDVALPSSPIPPGQTGSVVLRWTPIPGQSGPHSITCDLDTNDPTRPTVRVEMKGTVNPLVRVAPEEVSFLDFYRLEPGAVKHRELKVFSTKLSNFEIEARSTLPGLKVTKNKLEVDSATRIGNAIPTCAYSILIETTPQLQPGYFTGDLVLTVKPPEGSARTITMKIYGEVANGLFSVMPAEVEFKKPRLADGDAQKVRVQFIDTSKKQSLRIVKFEPAFLHCEEPRPLPGAKGQWEFIIRIPPKDPEAAKLQPDNFFEGRIVLQASESDVQIPVRVKWTPPEPVEKH
jgi:hypothetical protein